MKRLDFVLLILLAAAIPTGCSPEKSTPDAPELPDARSPQVEPEQAAPSVAPANVPASQPAESAGVAVTPEELEAALKVKNPGFAGRVAARLGPQGIAALVVSDPALEDISPLAGLPLTILDLHDSHVTDLSPLAGMELVAIDFSNTGISDIRVLKGMPLRSVYLERSRVKDIAPLSGSPLVEAAFSETPLDDISALQGSPLQSLRLVNTKVADIEALRGGKLQEIWLNNTPVKDCSPLASNPVVSVTLAGTKVSDIACFKGHPTLERLHIAETEITDLTPLQWMDGLTRLIFTPNRIKTGIQYARQMPSIREIGTAFGTPEDEGKMFSPDDFWQMYDEGKFN